MPIKPTAPPTPGIEVASGKPFAKAYTDKQGNIIDGAGVLRPPGSKIEPVPGINIYDALNASIRKKFEPLTHVSAASEKYLDINLIASAGGGRTAYVVGEDRSDDRKPFGEAIVYDTWQRPQADSSATSHAQPIKTGNLAVYNANTRELGDKFTGPVFALARSCSTRAATAVCLSFASARSFVPSDSLISFFPMTFRSARGTTFRY
jgi:hypothetical protein